MAEIASGVASSLLEKLTTKAYQEIVLAWGLKDDIERLKESVRLISAFLRDAEGKQFKNESITIWLQQLKNAFYDASDILDEIECEANTNKVMKMYGSCSQKVSRFFSKVVFRVKMAHKIKDTREKIDKIRRNGSEFGLAQRLTTHEMALNKRLQWRETHSSLSSRVIGRDEEKEEIISLLMSQSSQSQLDVVPIVAMGGCGKTTLAKLVYNDKRVISRYGDLRIWVHVSPNFDVKRIISEIVKSGGGQGRGGGGDNFSLEYLMSCLREKLHDKKVLLVLDDVWNTNARRWLELQDLLLDAIGERNKNESKILVTTRSHEVASIVKTGPKIGLKMLPKKECLKLFFKCAFQQEEEANQHPRLKEIGEEIVAKCGGLPLAVITLGCTCNSKQDENEWKRIRDSEIWEIERAEEEDGGILPALSLSYSELPSHLKQCFSYCAVFPENHEYMQIELIPFWMAHGLLQPTKENEDPEYLGQLYFRQLISASFFQPESDEQELKDILGIDTYKMHDRVHDLAMVTMDGETKVMTSSDSQNVNEKVRHLSISSNPDQFPLLPCKKNKVQSLMKWSGIEEMVPEPFVKWICKEFKYLRVLHLHDSDFHLLPDCFRKMKHLRYLDLSGCYHLEKLPKSICKLYNLQILNLSDCEELRELPQNMRNLVNLPIFFITAQITNLCLVDIRFFKSLQVLAINCPNLEVLPCDLGHLVSLKKLIIVDCENLVRFEDEVGNEGGGKDMNLQLLFIDESPKLINLPNWLQKATKSLQQICITKTRLTTLPEWLPNATSLNMLSIEQCEELLSLPEDMDNCRSLQHLWIIKCPKLYARYQKDAGPEWSKIAHVPNVYFRYDGVFEEYFNELTSGEE